MNDFHFDIARTRRSLFGALVAASETYGKARIILEDQERNPLTYGRLVLGALVLGRRLAHVTQDRERVGLMLPSAVGAAVALFALSAFGRVPALLNFTAGIRNLKAACAVAGLKTVVTSRRFVDQAKLDDVVAALEETCRIVYLEDVRGEVGILDKLRGVADRMRAGRFGLADPDGEGVVLFTSGSEGLPKAVLLSHANLVANAYQIRAHAGAHFSTQDVLFNPLPVFHSFGLTAGTLMGVLTGIKVVMYPSPLHYRQVPKLISETRATILLATDTFLQGYARAAGEGDLASVRFVVAGAERVKDETRAMWRPYGTTLLEGYGATECAPVLACNTPDAQAPGSVGRFLPGIAHRLEPVEGIAAGGRLHVSGPNVMLGYLSADRPGQIQTPPGGWHDTGDIVTVDEGGFVTIRGRAKRFAKIGGEMVSLAAVEAMVSNLWEGASHVVVSLPDPRKGEQLILVTDRADAERESLLVHARHVGFPELWVPRAILVVGQIPVMASGKIDHPATIELAKTNRAML